MLQKEYKQLINKFYKDLELLDLRNPVSVISTRMGVSKGNVSNYLNKKLEPSIQFIEKFYEVFKGDLKKVVGMETEKAQAVTPAPLNTDTPPDNMVPLSTLYQMLKEHYDDMKATKTQMLANNAALTNTNTVLVNTVASLQEEIKAVQEDLDEMTKHFSGLTNVLLLNQETMLRHTGLPLAPYAKIDIPGTQSSSLHVSGQQDSIKSDSGTVNK
jgi:transcriptional regulator with XRE-family HTH domain